VTIAPEATLTPELLPEVNRPPPFPRIETEPPPEVTEETSGLVPPVTNTPWFVDPEESPPVPVRLTVVAIPSVVILPPALR